MRDPNVSIMLTISAPKIKQEHKDGIIIIKNEKGEIIAQIRTGEPVQESGYQSNPFIIETKAFQNLELYINGCYSTLKSEEKIEAEEKETEGFVELPGQPG